jgi:hypothetical protein
MVVEDWARTGKITLRERELGKERLNERIAYTREQGYELGSF